MTEKLPTINLKGKEYVQVKDRIIHFSEKYPNGHIVTEVINSDKNMVTFKAVVYPESKDLTRCFNAHSFGTIDEVKAFEKLETVAVGRALALMGIGVIESVASADEIKRFEDKKVAKPAAKTSTSTTRKDNPLPTKIEKGDQLKSGDKKNGSGKWYAVDKANGERVWLTAQQFEYMQNYAKQQESAPLPTTPPPSPDDLVDLPF